MPEADNQQRIAALIAELRDYRTRHRARQQLLAAGPAAAAALLDTVSDLALPANMRWAAVTVLGALKHTPAVPVLLTLVAEDNNLRGAAAAALAQITGQDAGEDADAWKRLLDGPAETPPAAMATPPAAPQPPRPAPQVTGADKAAANAALAREALESVARDFTWDAEGGYAHASLRVENARRQQIIITFDHHDQERRPVVCLYTECGAANDEVAAGLEARNQALRYGKFTVEKAEEGGMKIVMRHFVRQSELTPAMLRDMALEMAAVADNLEAEISPHDRI